MIKLQGIGKLYARHGDEPVRALQSLSLEIGTGEFVAVAGSSGSGKSTLLNILGLLDRPSEGSYRLEGREVSGLSVDDLARLRNQRFGFVFQAFHLLPRTSALENVEFPLLYSDRSDFGDLAVRALHAVGLGDRTRHHPSELSGGEQQRVAIARALVNQPDILLADEPTGNLDVRSGLEIMAIFQKLSREGKTIVMVTHDPSLAAHGSRIVRIERGRTVTDEPVVRPKDAVEELAKLPSSAAA